MHVFAVYNLGGAVGVGFGVSVQLFRVASTTKSLPAFEWRKTYWPTDIFFFCFKINSDLGF